MLVCGILRGIMQTLGSGQVPDNLFERSRKKNEEVVQEFDSIEILNPEIFECVNRQ